MRNTANFHPEWGYLVPAPSFIRTARIVLVATIVGAVVGAGAVFSGVSRPPTEPSVGARTLVRSIEAVPVSANASVQAMQGNAPFSTNNRSLTVNGRSADGATNGPSAGQRIRAPDRIEALAEAPVATEGPSTTAIPAPPTAAKDPVLKLSLVKKKAMRKSKVTWRFALRDEPHGLAPGEYSKRRSWGGYWDAGGRRYENW